MTFQQKCTNPRDFYLVKKGPKNLGNGKPPPFGQCPKVSDFFHRMPSLTRSTAKGKMIHIKFKNKLDLDGAPGAIYGKLLVFKNI